MESIAQNQARAGVGAWIRRRPLALFSACYAAGIAIALTSGVPAICWGACLALGAGLALRFRRAAWIFALAMLVGALYASLMLMRPALPEARDVSLRGRIVEEPVLREKYVSLRLSEAMIDGQPAGSDVLVYVYDEGAEALACGALVRMRANVWPVRNQGNDHAFDYELYLWRDGIALQAGARAGTLTVLADAPWSPGNAAALARQRLRALIGELYEPGDQRELVNALVLGETRGLSDTLAEEFRKAGVAHILAVSGMHISMLALCLEFLLRRLLRMPRAAAFAISLTALCAYAFLIGFPISVVRALIMYAIMAGAPLSGRPHDSLTALMTALLVILILRPLDLSDAGLILSFSAVGGMLLLGDALKSRSLARWLGDREVNGRLRRTVGYLADLPRYSLAAQLGTFPATACLFHTMSTYALWINLPVIPLSMLCVPLAFVSLALGGVYLPLGRALAWLTGHLLDAMAALAAWAADLPYATVLVPMWPALLIGAFGVTAFFASPYAKWSLGLRRAALLALALICASAWLFVARPTSGLRVVFLDVREADSAVIFAEDRLYVMDAGRDGTLCNYLLAIGRAPDGVFISHLHADHAGGLEALAQAFAPGMIYLPRSSLAVEADEDSAQALTFARERGWQVTYLDTGAQLSLSARVEAVAIQASEVVTTSDMNDISLVLQVLYGEGSVLFTGDLPRTAERSVFPDTDLLKVAHHGANNGTSTAMLAATSPSVAVISVGRNSYGHPGAELLARLRLAEAAIYRTDEAGAVTADILADGTVRVRTHIAGRRAG